MALAAAAAGQLLPTDLATSLDRSLESVQPGTRSFVDLSTLLPFRWTRVYVFPSDTRPRAIDRVLGFSWLDAPTGGPAPDALPGALLVFVRSGTTRREVVKEVRYTGQDVRLDCIEGQSFARSRARFTVAVRLVAPFLESRRALIPVTSLSRTAVAPHTCLTPSALGRP
jgi:hypothetical protein